MHIIATVSVFAMVSGVLAAAPLSSRDVISVKVVVEGVRGKQGQLKIGLFHKEGFPRDERRALYGAVSAITSSNQVFVVTGVAPGDYAILVYHDENGNGQLDYDIIGRPKEGYGVSNNARSRWHAPNYETAKVTVSSERREFPVRLEY